MIACLVTRQKHSATPDFALRVLRQATPGAPRLDWQYSKGLEAHGISIAVMKAGDFHVEPVCEDKRYIYIVSGYLSRGNAAFGKQLASAVDFRHGTLQLKHCLDGIYTCIIIDKHVGTINAFSSMPALRPVFYGQTTDILAIGDRPYSIALSLDQTPRYSKNFVADYMGCGYSLGNTTPFADVFRTLNGEMITARKAVHRQQGPARPLPKPLEDLSADSAQEVADTLVETLSTLRFVPNVELRVSGGKDSRMLLAAIANTAIPCSPVIFSRKGGDEESRVAEELCRLAGKDLAIRQPAFPQTPDSITKSVDGTLRRMDGLIHTEARLAPYTFPRLFSDDWGARILGHAHLQRGGFARTMQNDAATIYGKAISYFSSSFITPEAAKVNERHVMNFADSISLRSHLDFLYLVNAQFRVSHYLMPHYLYERCDSLPYYPLVDQAFADLMESLPMFDKVSELTAFQALRKLEPRLADIPLAGKRWRFEARGPREGISGFELRDPGRLHAASNTSENLGFEPAGFHETSVPEPYLAALLEMIRGSKLYSEIKERLNADGRRMLEPGGEKFLNDLSGTQRKVAMQFFWTVFCITRSFEREWTSTNIA